MPQIDGPRTRGPGTPAPAKPVVLRRTAKQPTVASANNAAANQTINRIVRNNPQIGRVINAGVQKAAQAAKPKPDPLDGFLNDVGKTVMRTIGNIGVKEQMAQAKQAPGLAAAGKEFFAMHQQRANQAEGAPEQFVTGLGKAALATAEHPLKVGKATLKSIPGAVEGLVAGPVELLANPAGTLKGIQKDYGYRYGKDAGKAVQQEGLLPYALDVGTAGAGIGRAAGALAKAKESPIMADRPALRIGANAVKQDRSPNYFVAAGQSLTDKLRPKTGPNEVKPRFGDVTVNGVRIKKGVESKRLNQSVQFEQSVDYNQHPAARADQRKLFEKEMPKNLTPQQYQHGFHYALQYGIRTPEHARMILPKVRDMIRREPGQKPIEDQLPVIDKLLKNADTVFTPKLGQYADKALAMAKERAAIDPTLKAKDARERAITPQGLALGVIPRLKGEKIGAYEKRVAAARESTGGASTDFRGSATWHGHAGDQPVNVTGFAGKHGGRDFMTIEGSKTAVPLDELSVGRGTPLAEGGYFPHQEWMQPKLGVFTRGTLLHGAMRGHHETRYALLEHGATATDPRILEQGLAKNLKAHHQVNAVARIAQNFAYDHLITPEGEHIPLDTQKGNSLKDIQRAQKKAGLEKTTTPFNANAFYAAVKGSEPDAKNLRAVLDRATQTTDIKRNKGWVLVPNEVVHALSDSLRFQGGVARSLNWVKSLQTLAVLGSNVSWPGFRVFHNLAVSGLENVNPFQALMAAKRLPKEDMKAMNAVIGADPFHNDANPTRMGSTITSGSRLDSFRTALASPTKTGAALRLMNPAHLLRTVTKPPMWVERNQMAIFRRAAAFQKLSKDAKAAVKADTTGFLSTVDKARTHLLNDRAYQEELAHHVNRIYGDFTTYPGIQRLFAQNEMFYGYLRYATRYLLKTLPANHPIKANILLNLSRQNDRHTRKLLGLGPNDTLPFGADANVYSLDKHGNLHVQNFHRANPLGAMPLENMDNPASIVTSGLSLPLAEALSQITNLDLLRGAPLRTRGNAAGARPLKFNQIGLGDRGRIALNDILKLAQPLRIMENVNAQGRPIGNDSLPWDVRPIIHKQTQAIANDLEAQQLGKKLGIWGQIEKANTPFLPLPSRDNIIGLQIKQSQERLAGKHLTPQQKAAEEKTIRSQPNYGKFEQQAKVLSKQRSKPRGRKAASDPYGGFYGTTTAPSSGSSQYDSFYK